MGSFKKVLMALKPGRKDLPLFAFRAKFLAQHLGAELRLFSCVYEAQVAAGLVARDAQAFAAQTGLLEGERRSLKKLAQSLAEEGVTADIAVRWGYPAGDIIVAEAREWNANLLVIGVHRYNRVRLTDVDWRLMTRSPCPLLLVKDAYLAGYTTLLACVDPLHRHAEPSGLDDAVLNVAAELAKSFQSELSVIHAYPPPETFELASAVEVSPGVFYGSENVADVHKRGVLELMEAYHLKSEQAHLEPGFPEEVIPDQARHRGAELVVIGAIKRGWLEHAVLGSTAEKVAATVDCDVLLVGGDK